MNNCVCMESMRERLGLHPWHFWGWADSGGIGIGTGAPVIPVSGCDDVVYEYPYQSSGRVTRDELRKAITEAREKMAGYLGYSPVKTHVTERVWLAPADEKGCRKFKMCHGHVTKLGCVKTDFLGNASVMYADRDADTLNETAVITLMSGLPTGASADEIIVAFHPADIPVSPDDIDRWRICPVEVQANPAITVINARAWTLGRPVLREGFGAQARAPLDPTIPGNFAAMVRVYRRWVDTACTFTSGKRACGHTGACDCACVEQDCNSADVLPTVENCKSGIGVVRGLDADWIDIGYEVDPEACGCECSMCDALTALAVSMLKPPCCACQSRDAGWTMHRWQDDRALRTQDQAYLGATVETTPFGTRGGAIEAWQTVKRCRRASGLSL